MTEIILESISDGVFTVDNEWRVTSFNRAAETITGIRRSDAIGKLCHEVFKSNMCETECPLRRTMKSGKPVIHAEGYCINPEGERIPISVSTALLVDNDGKIIGGAETFRDLREIEELRQQLRMAPHTGGLSSRSPSMKTVLDLVPTVAPSNAAILIEGETGTGKEVTARAVHALSSNAGGPFVAVNCGALPDSLLESELFGYKKGAFTGAEKDKSGRFRQADKGTLFLDEIGEVSRAMQVKLLRVLQEGVYEPLGSVASERTSARIICASNRNLRSMVEEGTFRRDLFYRINVISLSLPPLRERKEDLPDLCEHFLRSCKYRVGKNIQGFTEEVYAAFYAYSWPGNIRELENVIERAVVLCSGSRIGCSLLPPELQERREEAREEAAVEPVRHSREATEAQLIVRALKRNHYNRTAAAEELGFHRATLYRKMEKYNIQPDK
jgi:PAS domain S-box-containing protein